MEKNVLLRRFQRTDWTEGEQTCEFYRIFWSNPLLSIADLRSLLDQTNGAPPIVNSCAATLSFVPIA